MTYIVEYPDSDEKQIVVVNSNGNLRKSEHPPLPFVERGIDLALDLATEGVTEMARRGVRKGVEVVADKISTARKKKTAAPNRPGKMVNTKKSLPMVAFRAPPGKPYVTASAPVSTGTSLAGSRTIARRVRNGHIVSGREFLGSAYDTKAISTWSLALGAPLTPVAYVDSLLRQYGSMYNYYRWRKLRVHYVTTSPTSTAGSIMLYYNKDRASTFLSQTSTNLLPFVLSDPHTTIGPQWQNMAVTLETDSEWKRLDYGLGDDVTHYTAGEIFLLSKTSANTDSPGMLLMEYEIEFKDQNLTPRLLLWPQPSINYTPYNWSIPATTTAGLAAVMQLAGTSPIGSNSNQLSAGGIYKVIVDFTNSSPWSATTPAAAGNTLLKVTISSADSVLSITDGSTLYAVNGTSGMQFYLNSTDAYAGVNPLKWNLTLTANGGASMFTWFSLLGFLGNASINPNM